MLSTWKPAPHRKPAQAPPGLHLYILQSDVTGAVKIGRSSHPDRRLDELQTGSPHKLKLLAVYEGRGAEERGLHVLLRRWRLRGEKGEWFDPDCLPNLPDWAYGDLPFEDRWWVR